MFQDKRKITLDRVPPCIELEGSEIWSRGVVKFQVEPVQVHQYLVALVLFARLLTCIRKTASKLLICKV